MNELLFGKKKESRLIALEKIKKQEKKDNILHNSGEKYHK